MRASLTVSGRLSRAIVRSRRVRAVSEFQSAGLLSVVELVPFAAGLSVVARPSGAGEVESPSAGWRTTWVVVTLRLSWASSTVTMRSLRSFLSWLRAACASSCWGGG